MFSFSFSPVLFPLFSPPDHELDCCNQLRSGGPPSRCVVFCAYVLCACCRRYLCFSSFKWLLLLFFRFFLFPFCSFVRRSDVCVLLTTDWIAAIS